MRVKVAYETLNEKLILPLHYNFYLQILIYNTLSPLLATKLHNEGFILNKRKFKLFTFSRILNKGEKIKRNRKDFLLFKNGISFYFSSPIEDIISDFGERGLKEKEFNLLNQRLFISRIEVITTPRIEKEVIIKMLSPVTIHSTLKNQEGKNISHYYKPNEKNFPSLIEKNAKKKYSLIYENEPDELNLNIEPYRFSVKKNLSVVIFKGTPIEGYSGIFKLNGSRELIMSTYDAGLGDKNSEGFGMWELWKGGHNAWCNKRYRRNGY